MRGKSISIEDLCGAEWEPESERKTWSKDELAEALERFAREVGEGWPAGARWYVEQAWDSPTSIEVILEEEGECEMKDEEVKIEEARKALRESIAKGLEEEAGRAETRRSEVAAAGFNPSVVNAWEARRDTLYDVWARVSKGEWG